jgi:uncharacterized repeat protein (TIGR01451 family)
MFRRWRVLRNGLAVVSASALAASLIAAVPASAASPSADIAVTDSASASVVPQGGIVTFTMTVTNLGPDAAQNVVMKTGGTFVGVKAPAHVSVSCATSSGIPTCTTPSLPSGGTPVTIVTRRKVFYWPHQFGQSNEAWATSDTFDPNLNNNVAYATYRRFCPCL